MIRVDPVRIDVLQFGQAAEIRKRRNVVEQILVRHHLRGSFLANGDVAVGLKKAAVKFGAELDALDIALRVIESAEHQRLSEVAVIDQVGRDLVVGVDAKIEIGAVLRCRLVQPNGIF